MQGQALARPALILGASHGKTAPKPSFGEISGSYWYAGDMVLATGASGGVYLGGGILPRIASMLASGTFCARFSAKRKVPEFVKDVPVWLITAKYPALTGACYLLREEH